MKKWQNSEVNPDSVAPKSVLLAIPLITELGLLHPTNSHHLLGPRAHLV